ncbi:MAG: hypothetical protein ACJ8C4_16120 [Gemmataceae bacterium]
MDLNLAILLIVLGLGLMAGELFFPTGGVLFLLAGVAVAAGVVMTFMYGDTSTGVVMVVVVFLAIPSLIYAMAQLWPRTTIGRRLIQPGADEDATLANMPVNLELEALRGRHGKALSDLRPAGAVQFDGKRVDVVSEGMMVLAGAWVRCIDVRAGRVVVRESEPADLKDIDLNDLGS